MSRDYDEDRPRRRPRDDDDEDRPRRRPRDDDDDYEDRPRRRGELSEKKKSVAFLLSLLLGGFGAHRFYVGKVGSGIGMLLTAGGCGIWNIVDLFMIVAGSFTDAEGRNLDPEVPRGKELSDKSQFTAFLLSFLLGSLGVHRFYVGKVGSGIAMLLTAGGCLIWNLIDEIMIGMGSFTDAEGRPLDPGV